jgi:hypothetical protein
LYPENRQISFWHPSHLLLAYKTGEMLKRPVEGSFRLRRKAAGRQFPILQMILQTSATGSFAGTWFISTIALLFILLQITVHAFNPLNDSKSSIGD